MALALIAAWTSPRLPFLLASFRVRMNSGRSRAGATEGGVVMPGPVAAGVTAATGGDAGGMAVGDPPTRPKSYLSSRAVFTVIAAALMASATPVTPLRSGAAGALTGMAGSRLAFVKFGLPYKSSRAA